jgi:ribonuclease P protein component
MAAIVSKKVARLSTSRHLLKRRMLHVLRPCYLPGVRLVAIAKPGSALLPYAALREELGRLALEASAGASR